MKEVIKYLRPYRGQAVLAIAMVTVSTFCDLMLPTIMSDIVNRGIYHADFPYILLCCGKMLVVAMAGLGSILMGTWASTQVVSGFTADIRRDLFKKVHTLTFEEFGGMGAAALITRSTSDVDTVSWIASMLAGTVGSIPVLFIGGVLLSFRKDWVLSLILLCFMPALFGVVLFVGRKVEPLWGKAHKNMDRQNDLLRERLGGIRVIRAFNREDREQERFAEVTRTMSDDIVAACVRMDMIAPISLFTFNAAALVIIYVGARRMEALGSPSAGDIFAIVQYISLVASGVMMASFAIVRFPRFKVAVERISQIFHAQGMPSEPDGGGIFRGDIDFEDVTFLYEGADEPAISGIDIHVRAGQKVSIIGGTGSGKSTLVQLLLGFRQPTEGRILLDGADAREWGRQAVRRNVSAVLQKPDVYSGTLRENLLMGNPDADEGRLKEAIRVAQLADFIATQKEGYEYKLEQSGKNLSGGQKQRVSIARAVVKDAPIYVFDDSFSALDFLTESKLREELNNTLKGHTRIIITQRVTSAMDSDLIYVMDRGRVVGSGTHSQLLESCSIYRDIYASQTAASRTEGGAING